MCPALELTLTTSKLRRAEIGRLRAAGRPLGLDS
jgi:hypothetical protein